MIHLKGDSLLQGGKYRIVRFINSGGFGCTYEAEHVMFRKRVAIKEFFVKDFCGRDERTAYVTIETTNKRGLVDKLKRKFIDEARSIFDLHHPGIVRVTDVFEENGTAYYVMDYIDGQSLKEVVDKEGALPEVRALGYIRQVADALEYVHAYNRLHLDIKPGNIMIDDNDHAILIDFGASRQYEEVGDENTSTLMPYTNGYAPPEQVGSELVKLTPATDLYALGATLYCLLSGSAPLSSNLRNCGDKLQPLPSSISFSTRRGVEKTMKLNRYDRLQSVDAFRKALKEEDVKPKKWWVFPIVALIAILGLFGLTQIEVATTGSINGHAWVDLGLSVKWATMNVGASSPGDSGDYFAWGEVHPKSEYWEDNSKTYDKSMSEISGNSAYDAACYHWGSSWRLPTKKELEELKDKCRWSWTQQDGHKGYKVVGPNGNSIFLPAAGFRLGALTNFVGTHGNYWSGSPDESDTRYAYFLYFVDGNRYVSWDYRGYGRSVRPVSD